LPQAKTQGNGDVSRLSLRIQVFHIRDASQSKQVQNILTIFTWNRND